VEAALLSAYGFRAGGQHWGGWSTLGVAAGLCALVVKAETDLVDVARVRSGRPAAADEDAAPRSAALGAARRVAQVFKVHQLTGALESSFLLLVAAVIDLATDSLHGSRWLAGLMFGIAATMAVLHLASVLASRRLQ
jgi:hypothetical protein